MSDHPTFHERQLDRRIRELVARAAAEAPPAPEVIPLPPLDDAAPRRDRRPWWVVGSTLLGAAAAVIALVFVNARREDTIAPAMNRPEIVAPAPAPESTTPTSGSPATSTAPAPAPTSTSTSTEAVAGPGAATPSGATTPVEHGPGLAVADGSSVELVDLDGEQLTTIEQPWTIALAVGDGRVVGQERSGAPFGRWETVATTPRIWSPDGTVRVLFPVVGERAIRLHDIAIVTGTPWLLYSVHNGDPTPDGQREDLHAVSLDGRGEVLDIGQIGAWESGTSRLHLGANGLIVGESYSEAVAALLVLALPDSPATAWADDLTSESLGLEDHYVDCADTCPTSYTLDAAGATIGWVERGEIVTVAITDGAPGAARRNTMVAESALVGDLELLPTPELSYVVSYFQADGEPPRPAQLVLGDGDPVELSGPVATSSPVAADAEG